MKWALVGGILLLFAWAFLSAKYSLLQSEYVPFVGNVQYFCSRQGVEYLLLEKIGAIALHVSPAGQPVPCSSNGVHI